MIVEFGSARAPNGADTKDPSPYWLQSTSLIQSVDGPGSGSVAACEGQETLRLFSNNAAGRKTAKRWNRGPYHLAAPAAEKDKTRTRHQTKTGGLGDDVKGSPECSGSLD